MPKRYILIDSHSGYVWGEATADDVVSAAREVDADAGVHDRQYEDLTHDPRTTAGYYHVHDATGSDLPPVENGQDQDVINRVSALPVAGYVTWA